MIDKPKSKLQVGWVDNQDIEKQFKEIDATGVVSIQDRLSIDEFYLKCEKREFQNLSKLLIKQLDEVVKWETALVMNEKLHHKLGHKYIKDHPVVIQRDKLYNLVQKYKDRYKEKYVIGEIPEVIKQSSKLLCDNLMLKKLMDTEFKELNFGESLIVDYYKYGNLLKVQLYKQAKETGLHLPKSQRQVKVLDKEVENLTKMHIEDLNSLQEFDKMTRELINAPLPYKKIFKEAWRPLNKISSI